MNRDDEDAHIWVFDADPWADATAPREPSPLEAEILEDIASGFVNPYWTLWIDGEEVEVMTSEEVARRYGHDR